MLKERNAFWQNLCLNQQVSAGNNKRFSEPWQKIAPIAIGKIIPLQLKTGSWEVLSYHILIRAAQNFSGEQISGTNRWKTSS